MSARKPIDELLAQGKIDLAVSSLCNLGASYADNERAKACFEECLRLQPNHFESAANLALIHLEDIQSTASLRLQFLDHALMLNSSWFDGLKAKASLLDDEGDELGAISFYEKALIVIPKDIDTLLDLSLVLSKSGNLPLAIQKCKQALNLNFKNARSNLILSELLWRNGANPAQVGIFVKNALDNGKNDSTVLYNAHLLASTAWEVENPQQSRFHLEQAVTYEKLMTPKRFSARIRLHCLLWSLNEVVVDDDGMQQEVCEGDEVGQAFLASILLLNPLSSRLNLNQPVYSSLVEHYLLNFHFPDSSRLTHKIALFQHLSAHQQQQQHTANEILPLSTIVSNASQVTEWMDRHPSCPLFFLKNPSVQRGQGIFLLTSSSSLPVLDKPHLLQLGIHPPYLLHGRKFGLRTHVLLVQFPMSPHRSVFVFPESILTKCWSEYDVAVDNALTHISSTSVQRTAKGFDRDAVKGLASDLFSLEYSRVFAKLKAKLLVCFQACFQHQNKRCCYAGPMFQLFGLDSMVRADGEPFILEANASPQFQDAKRNQHMMDKFARPMTHGVVEIMCNGFEKRHVLTESQWEWLGDV